MSVILLNPKATDGGGLSVPYTRLARLALQDIEADSQARTDFAPEALASLAKSLKSQGQIVPILVYLDPERNKHILIDGERRFRAATDENLPTLEAVVFPFKPTPHEVAIVQLTIDQQREDLNAVEKALAYDRVMKANGWSANELAAQINVAHTTITRAVDMLTLSPEFQEWIRNGTLSPSIARELARLPEGQRSAAWKLIQDEGLNGNGAQKLVSKLLKPKKKTGRPKSKDKHTYKNLSGFEAVITPKKITLTPTHPGKPRSNEEIVKALEMLVQRFRDDIAKTAANENNATGALIIATPPPAEIHAAL